MNQSALSPIWHQQRVGQIEVDKPDYLKWRTHVRDSSILFEVDILHPCQFPSGKHPKTFGHRLEFGLLRATLNRNRTA